MTLIRTFAWWDRIVSDRIAKNARPVHLSHGTLVVHTSSAVWAQELSYHEPELLSSIQREVPTAKVARLRIRVGPLPPVRRASPAPSQEPSDALRVSQLPENLARALASVGDDQLRSAITQAACQSLGSRRGRK